MQGVITTASEVIASIHGPILELKTYLEKLPQDQKAAEASRTELENIRNQKLLTHTTDLAEKVGQAAKQFSQMGDLAAKLDSAAKSLGTAGQGLSEFGTQVLDAAKEQRESSIAAKSAALSGERTAASLEKLPQEFSSLASSLQSAGASVKSGAEAARDSYRELMPLQKQWFSGVEVGLKALKDQLQAIIKAYGEQVEGQTKDLMNQWTSEVTKCLQTYSGQVDQLQGELDELMEAISNMRKR